MLCEDGIKRPDAIEAGAVIDRYVIEFIENGRRIGEKGLSAGVGGNMSIKTPCGMLITRSGATLADLKREDLVIVVNVDGDDVYYVGSRKPSVETIMHWMIYEKRPEVNAISHVNAGPKEGKEIVTSDKEIPWGTRELGIDTSGMFEKADIAMMKNHGVVAVGDSLTKATEYLIECADNKKLFIFT
jgi:ribulose-5-phosphate 4-epimerase/fuculose-1-phosphate aldolase